MQRATTFGGMLLYLVAAFISGLVILSVGYWVSDMVYEAELWPIGAAIRIFLLLFLFGWIAALAMFAIASFGSLFTQDER